MASSVVTRPPAGSAPPRPERILMWAAMIGGVFAAGVAFVYKIAEFIFTLNESSVQGFADIPVAIYFVVAAGWLCLLVWCFVSGQFKNIEEPKYEMLRKEEDRDKAYEDLAFLAMACHQLGRIEEARDYHQRLHALDKALSATESAGDYKRWLLETETLLEGKAKP